MKFLQILLFIIGFSISANAQKSILTGTVYDANGAVIADAKVSATNEKDGKFETQANSEGIYVLELPYKFYIAKDSSFKITSYKITAESEGFEKSVLKNFKFVSVNGRKMFLDFALEVSVPKNFIIN